MMRSAGHRLADTPTRFRFARFAARRAGWLLPVAIGVAAVLASSCNLDPVHRQMVNDLGPERSDLYPPESEFHRPGEPCAVCHSKLGPADSTFVLAGTVFWGPDSYERRVDSAYVRILDANKTKRCFVTNCNGNFFVRQEDFPKITFPILVSVERTNDPGRDETELKLRKMVGHIGDEASCAICHLQGIRDYASPGSVRLYDTESQVPGDKVNTTCPKPGDQPIVTQCPEDRL